ncbi:MAG: NAD-dependent epimerase/dehydratase family protein, partial [Acidimicrobiia bacterium]|nr:NAD-dependent epimerase/dehydratase family protein [Acidimicrobiia bacterium]
MKYLITGGAGFIGPHLFEALLDAGHTVVALDGLSTGSMRTCRSAKTQASSWAPRRNIAGPTRAAKPSTNSSP